MLLASAVAAVGGCVAGRLSVAVADRYGERRTRVPLTEVVMAALAVVVVISFGAGWAMLPPLVAAWSLVTLSVVDLRCYRLPDAITAPSIAASLGAVTAASLALGGADAVLTALGASLGFGLVMWLAHEVQPHGLGFGDVKLAPLLGLHIGWVAGMFHSGWVAALGLVTQALLLSCVIGLAMGLVLAALRRTGRDPLPEPGIRTHGARRQDRSAHDDHDPLPHLGRDGQTATRSRLLDVSFPFGPALSVGTLIVILFSDTPVGEVPR